MATVTNYQSNESIDFNDLYLQYVREIEEEQRKSILLKQQLQEIRAVKHLEYNDIDESRRDNNNKHIQRKF